jgi:response regulator RpfG family c-di-GMP phosphodiesterase
VEKQMDNQTILIIDDKIDHLDHLIELLDQYDIIEATNGNDALI